MVLESRVNCVREKCQWCQSRVNGGREVQGVISIVYESRINGVRESCQW